MRENSHLSEDELIWTVVDEGELPVQARVHLAMCSQCRSKCEGLRTDLERLSGLAERFTPSLRRRVVLPLEEPAGFRHWLRRWRIAFAAAAIASVLVALWFAPFERALRNDTAVVGRELWEDERFMAELSTIESIPLPAVDLEIVGASYEALDEDFMDFVVPPVKNAT